MNRVAILAFVLFMTMVVIAFFLIGVMARNRANFLYEQIPYYQHVSVTDPPTYDSEKEEIDEDILWLIKNDYFKSKLNETQFIKDVKVAGGSEYVDRYFPDAWSLIRFADFLGDEEYAHVVVKRMIDTNYLLDDGKCLNFRLCETDDKEVNVDSLNAATLFDVLLRLYLKPALQEFHTYAIVDANDRLTELYLILRQIHFPTNADANITSNYNTLLIISAFLTQYGNGGQRPGIDLSDIDNLVAQAASTESIAEDDFKAPELKVYARGINKFWSSCFMDASAIFESEAKKTSHDPLAEVFAFLALRSLARPFVDLTNLVFEERNKRIYVSDCNKRIGIGDYERRFDGLRDGLVKQYIRHKGLLADIKNYAARFPRQAIDTAILAHRVMNITDKQRELWRRQVVVTRAGGSENGAAASASEEQYTVGAQENGGSESEEADNEGRQEGSPKKFWKFIWPLSGTIITPFKSGGNDGINIAVPEGTPVKAAEDGIVVYAGDGLKGYGNLVLIKHGNGYVSAYANNKQLYVKRGQNIERGGTIAVSGQSGNVTQAQLHFELRRGSAPVNPLRYLPDP